MAARCVEIADAIVTAINAQSFSLAFTAVRRWLWYQEVSEIVTQSPVVSVLPRDVLINRPASSREQQNRQHGIVIAVQQKLPETGETAEIDALILLSQEIYEFLEPTAASAALEPSGAGYVMTEHEDGRLYDEDDLRLRLFTSLMTFVYSDLR